MDSKKIMAIVAAIVVIVLAAGAYFFMNMKSEQAPQTTTATEQQNEQEASTTATLRSLIAGGKNQTCKITYPADSKINGSGTVYTADNKVRGDFILKDESGKEYDGHFISDGQYGYSWSSMSTQGVKIKIDQSATDASKQNVDLDSQVNLDCSSWSVDNSKFTVPADVKFTDLGTVSAPSGQPSQGQNMKAACDQITDPQAKAACLQYAGGQ